MQKTTLSLLISLCFIVFSSVLSPALAADKEYCETYARALINLPHKGKSALEVCQQDQPHWSADKAAHIQWCLGVSQAEADKKLYAHNKLVNLCNDTYKLIMIDRKQSANLPVSANEVMAMKSAPDSIKDVLINGEIKNASSPFSKLYPVIHKAINDGSLKDCAVDSLAVDMDNNADTKEWVLSIDSNCLTDQQYGHIWLVQQIGDQYNILFEGEDNTLTLRYSETSTYKNITIASHLSGNEETTERCGSIIADWHYIEGRYLPVKGKADLHGDCLPEYNLPDSLQGANTYEIDENEWKRGMEEEEKKREALFAPYKKALVDYIPEWIKNTEQLIPANPKTNLTTNKLLTKEKTPNPAKENKEEDKSFMRNVRSFLGLE